MTRVDMWFWDTEANVLASPPVASRMGVASDTGRTFIGDGTAWRRFMATWRGSYDSAVAYQKLDWVAGPDGNHWLALRASIGVTPVEGADWTLFLPKGPQGIQGPRGFSVLNGTGAPSAGTGVDGDYYIDNTAHTIYRPKTAGAWGSATSLVGPQGPIGLPAYTTTTGFTQPAVGSTVSAVFGNTGWMVATEVVYVAGGGYYSVASVTDATHAVLTNLGYPGNAAAGATIANGSAVAPGGLQGATGPIGPINTIQDEGAALTQRSAVNFVGAGVVAADNAGPPSRTDVTITGAPTGSAGGELSGTYPNPTVPVKLATADLYPDFAGPGSVPATSANLTTTTPAQILYLAGNRVPFASESHNYGTSTTTFIDGTPAGAFVYTTGSLTAGNFRMFSVVTSGSAITTVTDLRGWHPLEGEQTGLVLTVGSAVTNANQLTLTGGSCYQPGTRKLIAGASVTLPTLTLAASTWYYVYVYDNAGVLTADVSTTAPTNYQGEAKQKTGDGTRRYRGAIKTNASGRALCYDRIGTAVRYKEDMGAAPLAILVNQVPTNPVSLGAGIPPTSKTAYFEQLGVSGTGYFQTSDDPMTDGTSVGFSYVQGVTWVPSGPVPINASQQVRVEGSPTMYLSIAGYAEGLG